jgi:Domain of unknown function (DUF1918)
MTAVPPRAPRRTSPADDQSSEVVAVRAHVGDQLVVGTDRIGVVIGVLGEDGSPPYVIKWLNDGHIAMVQPDQYARIIPATQHTNSSHTPKEPS